MGFELHLVDDKLSDWRPIRGRPSLGPKGTPAFPRWMISFWLIIFGGAAFYGVMLAFNRELDEKHALQRACKTRDIPTQSLPAEFRFITHATAIQDVIDNVGPCTLIRKHEVSERFAAEHECVEGRLGNPTIVNTTSLCSATCLGVSAHLAPLATSGSRTAR